MDGCLNDMDLANAMDGTSAMRGIYTDRFRAALIIAVH
jgi:hypothetical protein